MSAIATHVAVIVKSLERPNTVYAHDLPFVQCVSPRAGKLQSRFREKHDKTSLEGQALRALREIRVRAAPSWNDSEIQIMFWFIRDEMQVQFQGKDWIQLLDKWLKLIPQEGRFQSVEGQVVTLEDITAKDYVESDPLDLEHLSS